MGMFDYVDYECTCPVCHSKVDGFQSKDGECWLNKVLPGEVSNFYSSCKQCGCWIEFNEQENGKYKRTVESRSQGKVLDMHTKEVAIKAVCKTCGQTITGKE